MSKSIVDIIVPFVNDMEFMNVTLDSIFRQTHSNFRIRLLNLGSKDGTPYIINEYPQDRISYMESTDALEPGILFTIQPGDILYPGYISSMVELLETYDACISSHYGIEKDGYVKYVWPTHTDIVDRYLSQLLETPPSSRATCVRSKISVTLSELDSLLMNAVELALANNTLGFTTERLIALRNISSETTTKRHSVYTAATIAGYMTRHNQKRLITKYSADIDAQLDFITNRIKLLKILVRIGRIDLLFSSIYTIAGLRFGLRATLKGLFIHGTGAVTQLAGYRTILKEEVIR